MFNRKHWKKSLIVVLSVLVVGGAFGLLTKNVLLGQPAVGTTLKVTQVSVGWEFSGASRQPYAYVLIRDEYGNPVNGALVTGDWSGCNTMTGASATTKTFYDSTGAIQRDGAAQVFGKKHSCLNSNCKFIFTVTKVSMTGMTYVATVPPSSGSTPCNPLF